MVIAKPAGGMWTLPELHDGDSAHARGGEEQERAI